MKFDLSTNLANLNILPTIIAVVLLSLWLENKTKYQIPVQNVVHFTVIVLLKYCYTFSYRMLFRKTNKIECVTF